MQRPGMRRLAAALTAALVATTIGVLATPSPVAAVGPETGTITTFTAANISNPEFITVGPDRNLWFTSKGSNRIGRITVNGTITLFTNANVNQPNGITTGPDGALWFTSGGNNRIGRITTSGVITTFTGPGISLPYDITTGPDGELWFTNRGQGNESIGHFHPTTHVVTTIDSSEFFNSSNPGNIITGPDGNIWFSLFKSGSLFRLTPAGVLTKFEDFTHIGQPLGLAINPTDNTIWFTNLGDDNLGRINPLAGNQSAIQSSLTHFTDPDTEVDRPTDLTLAPDGNFWFTNTGTNRIGRVDPDAADPGASIVTFSDPENQVNFLTTDLRDTATAVTGPDGHVWFTSGENNRIGQIRTEDCNVSPWPHGFPDVPNGSFFDEPVDWAKCHDLVSGFPDGTYHPNDQVNRGQIVSILWVMMGSPLGSPAHGFPDIPANVFYERALRWAKAEGLVTGFPDGRYKPKDPVNRCQLVNMAWNMAGAPPGPWAAHGYTDVRAGSFCETAIRWAKARGLIANEAPGTLFKPKQGASRAEVADILFELASDILSWQAFEGQPVTTWRFQQIDPVVHNQQFGPKHLAVDVGATVEWTNLDITAHTVTSDTAAWVEGSLPTQGSDFQVTFNTPGTFTYHCAIHAGMTGSVRVEP